MRDQVPHDLTPFGLAAGAAGPGHPAAPGLGILTPLAPLGRAANDLPRMRAALILVSNAEAGRPGR